MAISVTNEEPKIQAAQLADRVSALSEALTRNTRAVHGYHRREGMSKAATWRECHLVSCRRARNALEGDFA